ncbi:MAG: hypothetical protein ACI8WM_000110 [Burkholderiaceae bacterium]|jgi:hypothetical protein
MNDTIALEAARAGMVLGADVEDANGNTLLPQGALLTDVLLASLLRRGIAHVQIDDGQPEQGIAMRQKPSQEAITARVDFIFRHASSAASAQLRTAILTHALKDS